MSDMAAPSQRSPGTLHYARHFILLTCSAAVLAATHRWRPWHGAVLSFGLYGALHSSALVLSLRASRPLRRKLLFVAIAASLSMLSVILSLYGGRLIGTLPGTTGPVLLLATSAGLGAASYAFLVRRALIDDLPFRALVSITLGCVVATLAVLLSHSLATTAGGLWFAVGWWFAFSAGLWRYDAT